jgi:hypothetical protein
MMDGLLSVRVETERQALAIAGAMNGVPGLNVVAAHGAWEVSLESAKTDRLITRFLNAIQVAVNGEAAESALVTLNGREYRLEGQ